MLPRRLKRIGGIVVLAGGIFTAGATAAVGVVLTYGDTLADLLLVAGHRVKNAATPVEAEGVSLVCLQTIEEQARREQAEQYRQAKAEADAAERVTTAFVGSRSKKTQRGGAR